MQTNYLEAISTVLNLMKQPDSVCKNISMHRTCYTTLFKYLMDNGISFSMDAALEWLEIKRKKFPTKLTPSIGMHCYGWSTIYYLAI